MKKKNIKILLLVWDITTIVLISFSVFLMFETFIKKLLIDSNIKDYYEIIEDAQTEYKNAIIFLNEKTLLPYKESIIEIINYLKSSALNKSKFENNIVLILNNDSILENIAGSNINKNFILNKNAVNFNDYYLSAAKIPLEISVKEFNSIKNMPNNNNFKYIEHFYKINDQLKKFTLKGFPNIDEAEKIRSLFSTYLKKDKKNHIEFSLMGKNYIGVASFLSIGLYKDLDKNNIDKFYPIIVVADLKKDFFCLIDRIRNIFLIILGMIFFIITAAKLYNTFIITNEIDQISSTIKNESSAIEKKGEIGTALKNIKLLFSETSHLYDSYTILNEKLVQLGEIVSGISDKELFIAVLKNDKRILDPHEVNMAVMFLDVKGFTSISEAHKEKSMNIINYIWSETETIIYKYNGKINKYIGDAALIIFPEKNDDNFSPAQRAILSAFFMLENVNAMKEKLKVDFNFRIGIDYGVVIYGKTGSTRNFELGVIGDTVNTASRFESLNKQYNTNVLITENALNNAGYKPNKSYLMSEECANNSIFYLVDRARPHGKKEVKDIYTMLLNFDKKLKFLGSDILYHEETFDQYSEILSDFFNGIKIWQNNNKSEGTKKWISLAKYIGKFHYDNKFPVTEIFLNKLLKYEEFLKYKSDTVSWLKQTDIQIKIPDDDWIKYGTIELSK